MVVDKYGNYVRKFMLQWCNNTNNTNSLIKRV
jgi:hypothetical protein